MVELATGDLLRIAIFSGFVGLVIFVVSYTSVVWVRRNRGAVSTTPTLVKIGFTALALGFLATVASWAVDTFTPRSGVVEGKDLFVVHNRRDATVSLIAHQERVTPGAVVAEFRPTAIEGQLAVIDKQIKEAATQIETLQARALPLDVILVQRQAQLRAQLDQQRQLQFELQRSWRDLERDHLALQAGWARDKAQIDADLAAAKKSLETTTAQVEAAKVALDRVQKMFSQQLTTSQRVEERTSAYLALQLDHNRDQVAVTELQRRAESLNERYETSNATFTQQLEAVRQSIIEADKKAAELKTADQDVERLLEADRARANSQVESEMAAAKTRVETLQAERQKITETTIAKVPFEGKVVYRHPSPGLAADNAPVLAIASGSGFTARVLMFEREADSVASTEGVQFALEDPTLVKRFDGKFQKIERTSEPGRVVALFDVELPLETVTALGAGRDVKVRLLWQPAFYAGRGFQGGALLAVVGLICLGFGSSRRQRDSNLEAQPQAAPTPETTGTVVEFRSRRPQNMARTILTRDRFLEAAEADIRNAISNHTPLGILLIRIDNLRDINKAYGRDVGNLVFQSLAERCSGMRESDKVGRWSGEELVLLLPETDQAGVEVVAQRVHSTAENLTFDDKPSLRISVTVSAAEPHPGEVSILPALYRASHSGDDGERSSTSSPSSDRAQA
ncbi:diguanylate cyclase domain-containing protein [Microvirga sp. G4-2]|uniref:diguanylate cyclase domain-containing protein n=1 Tax=Microvirga sp. G4-2 TaxID=3434467 RepID=UPI004044C34C